MGYGYNLEEGLSKLPVAIQDTEEFVTRRCQQVKDSVTEITTKVNADRLTKIGQAFCDAVDAAAKSLTEMCGTEGDNMHDGTYYGGLKGLRQIDEAMNGGR